MTKIKICGLNRLEDISYVNQTLPDYAGFIVNVPKSHRNVSIERLKELTGQLDSRITPVGVFVNEPIEVVADLLNAGTIAIAQLHGNEDETYICRLRELTKRPMIKAFSIHSNADFDVALHSSADYILFDHGAGGTGETFDWGMISNISRPWFLAGGLSAENIPTAIECLKPYCIDLSSSVETLKKKDFEKIQQVVSLVRSMK